MTNQIVTVNVTQTVAPAPSTLQQTGAFISMGGTTSAANSLTLLTQFADLTPLLTTPSALTSLAWSGGTVTATTAAPHGLTVGAATYSLTIAGAVPAGYNGTYACTISGTSTFTYAVASNPGSETTPGTFVSGSVLELQQMATTWFAQGAAVSVYVLELGKNSATSAVAVLTTWLQNNPQTVYTFLTPRSWDVNAAFLTLLASFENTTAMTYFYVTTTNATFSQYTILMKDVRAVIEPPTINALEFQAASMMWNENHQRPSSTNKVPPFSFTFLFGVTPYPTVGNQALFSAWKTAGVNWVGTGAQGGISTAIWLWGTGQDVRPINYWYTVDWTNINITLSLSNAVINGSNDPINPLYLNQDGINRLQSVGAGILSSGVTFGLILGTVKQAELDGPTFGLALENGNYAGQAVINAVPFVPYYTANPSDYRNGVYNGFSAVITPLRGFEQITFNLNISDFVA